MYRWMCLAICSVLLAWAADDPWQKVKDLKSGTEIRVVRRDGKPPVIGQFDELTDENVMVALKNEQVAIPRDKVERLDARPPKSRIVKESKTTVSDPAKEAPKPGQPGTAHVPSTSSSSGISFGGKADFETIYRRPVGAPAPAAQK